MRFETECVHAGLDPDPYTGAIVPPISQASTYVQKAPGEFVEGYDYSRSSNPTRTALENALGELEGGLASAFSSGMASEHALITAVCSAGDHVVIPADLYGGTVRSHPERAAAALESIAGSLHRSRRGYALQLAATVGWTSLPVLRLIRAPTLVVAGDDDPIIPPLNATILGRGIPDARVVHHPGGHLAIVTEAQELAGAVEEFLAVQLPDGMES